MRRDLTLPQQVVQSCHAAIEVARSSITTEAVHPSVIVCGVKDEQKLLRSYQRLQALGLKCYAFYEPDFGDELTAIASEPVSGDDRSHFRQYQLLNEDHILRTQMQGGAA